MDQNPVYLVAVGTTLSGDPPHRSRRAELLLLPVKNGPTSTYQTDPPRN